MRIVTPAETIELGTTEIAPTISFADYSRRVTDDFGVTTVVRRGFQRRMSVRLGLPFTETSSVQRQLADLRATPVRWVVRDDIDWLNFNGFYKDFSLDLAVPPLSYCTLTVEGLAETEVGIDPGGDPAPSGKTSKLLMLRPVDITGAMLASSNVPENDYPEWSAGTTYALGARVIKSAAHRVYESAGNGNTGNDPAGASGLWIDVGPTNRWAMLDQALGTLTTRAGGISLTLNTGAIDTLALLDVTGTTIRVQAPGYDRTVAVGPGAIIFHDVPGAAGQTVVTISGAGTVSAGTLMIGHLLPLGITEASPTAGITDFSRKEVDEFGEVTIVPRSWSKNMATNALIRTDAIDMVANRIAGVRARPSLWIAHEGTDCLTVYGFFKDFSIEVSQNISKLSLSIEGLSEAAPLSRGLPAPNWPDIIDSAPVTHPKPDDGATVGGTVGENIKGPGGGLLTREDLITAEGTSANTAKVGGVAAATLLNNVSTAQANIADLYVNFGSTENAATSAAAAIAAANAAGGAATVATAKRDEASGFSSSAQASAVTARLTAARTIPSTFEANGTFFSKGYNGEPSTMPVLADDANVNFPDVAGVGRVCEVVSAAVFEVCNTGALQVLPGHIYQSSFRHRTLSGTRSLDLYMISMTNWIFGLAPGNSATVTSTTSWQTHTLTVTGDVLLAAGRTHIRSMGRTSAGASAIQWASIGVEDITESANAGTHAIAASASAASAGLSASSASTSQIVSAAHASPRGLTPNADFATGMALWYTGAGGGGPPAAGAWYANDGGALGVWVSTVGSHSNLYSSLMPIKTSRKYKIRGRVYSHNSTGVIYIGATSHDTNGAPIGGNAGHNYIAGWAGGSKPNGWHDIESEVMTGEGASADLANWFRLGTKQIRLCAFLNYASLGATQYFVLDSLWLEDVTDSVASAAQALIAAQQAAIATDAMSASQQSAILSASIGSGLLTPDPGFDNYPNPTGGPAQWSFAGTGLAVAARVADPQGGYAMSLPGQAGTDNYASGGAFTNTLKSDGYYVAEADVRLDAGTFVGSGVLCYVMSSAGSVIQSFQTRFFVDPDQSGAAPGNGVVGQVYQFRKLFRAATNSSVNAHQIYAMSHWSSFGSVAAANQLTWYKCGIRPATQAEIRDQTVLAPMEATVSIVSGAIAEIKGRTRAYLQQQVNAGSGAEAFLTMQAETNNPVMAPLTLVLGSNTQMMGLRGIIMMGGSAWNEGARSVETYTGTAYASFTVTDTVQNAMVGLSDHPTSVNYSDIDFAIYKLAGTYYIYESGVGIGAITTQLRVGDTLSVEYSGTTVIYKWNGKAVRPVTTTAGRTFRMTVSLNSNGSTVDNLVFGPTPPVRASTVGIGASEVHIFNEVDGDWKKAVSFAGGNALFSGNIGVGGGIYVGDRAIPVALQSFDIQVYDGLVVSYGANLGNIPALTPDFSGFPALPGGQSYVFRAESHTASGFVARVKKTTAGTWVLQTGAAGFASGTGPAFQSHKPVADDALNGIYRFKVAGTIHRRRYNEGDPVDPIWVYDGWIDMQTWFRPAGSATWIAGPIGRVNAPPGALGNIAYDTEFYVSYGTPIGLDGSNTEFGVSFHSAMVGASGAINTLTAFNGVLFQSYSGGTESSATPGNLPALPVKVSPKNA